MEEIIKKMPTWLIAIALAAFVGMLGHSLFVSGKPFQMFGQQWGAIVEVPTPPPAVTALPAGLIVASESECKTLDGGWSTYTPATARVIVGAGTEFHPKHQDWFMRLPTGGVTPHKLEAYTAESGGSELEVTLTENQMPMHNHISINAVAVTWAEWGHGDNGKIRGGEPQRGSENFPGAFTSSTDGSQPHPNMPPTSPSTSARRTTDADPCGHART